MYEREALDGIRMKEKSKMQECDSIIVYPCSELSGSVRAPGDKSISHRVAILSALASGTSNIQGFLHSEDCLNTVKALEMLGAEVVFKGDDLAVVGTGGEWLQPDHALYLGNSGTGMRLLTGLLAGSSLTIKLTGDHSLCSRPMKRIQVPLDCMGASVEFLGEDGCAPIRIRGGQLHGIDYHMPVASAQVKSCILLAGLFSKGITRVHELLPTRDHTERLFRMMGIPVTVDGMEITLNGFGEKGPELSGRSWVIPGDFSSAAFWLLAASAMNGACVTVHGVGLNPRRTALLDVLRRMGAVIDVKPDFDSMSVSRFPSRAGLKQIEWQVDYDTDLSFEPYGDIQVQGRKLYGTEVGGKEIPNLIDECPLVAVAGALAEGTTVIRDARELRVKESDRIASMANNLRLMGVALKEQDDGLVIHGGAPIRGNTRVDSYGDHRIAMAMAILALYADGPVSIEHVACVQTSYPDFWNHLKSLGVNVEFNCSH